MKQAWLAVSGRRVPLRLPETGAKVLLMDEPGACRCKVPVHVVGVGKLVPGESEREVTAEARCWECNRPLGQLVLEMETLFGVREDIAVLEGRPRAYDGRESSDG